MKKRIFSAFLLVFILALPIVAHAQEDAVVIQYSRAVALANYTLQGLDDIFEEMQELQDELRREIRRLERGDWASEVMQDLFEELDGLEWRIFYTHMNQEQMQHSIELSIQAILDGMANPENTEHLDVNLHYVIASMMAAQGMSGNMAMMQGRLADIFNEIERLRDGTQARELAEGVRHALQETEHQVELLRFQHQQSKLVVENTLRGLILTVAELEANIEALEANLALTEESLRRITIRHEFGLASNNEVVAARRALTLGQMGLTQRQANLYNARNSLNYLLGQPLSQYTIIKFDLDLPEIPEDLTEHISEILPTTPTIRRLQMYVDREHEAMRAYRGTERDTRTALREAYESAVQRRDQAKRTMEAVLRRAYNDLANLQTQQEVQLLELYRTQQALEVAETSLRLGRITRHEVQQAQLAVFQAEQAIASILNQKWALAFRLENPSLLN